MTTSNAVSDLIIFPVHWRLYQLSTEAKLEIHAWCLNRDNQTCLLRIQNFHPHVYLELDPKFHWDDTTIRPKIDDLKASIPSLVSGKLVTRTRLYGAKELMPENTIKFLQLNFNNTVGINRLSYEIRGAEHPRSSRGLRLFMRQTSTQLRS